MMKSFLLGLIISLLGVIAYLLYFTPKVPDGSILVTAQFIDSLNAVANRPPVVVTRVDSVSVKDTVYVEKTPPVFVEVDSVLHYSDSLKTDDVSVFVDDMITRNGIVLKRKWAYRLHVPVMITKEVHVSTPVPIPYEQVNRQRNYKFYAGVSYSIYDGNPSIEGGIVRKNRLLLGAELGHKKLELGVKFLF